MHVRGAVLLLIACLVADMAMPVLPGAFRLDPSEAIEVTAGRAPAAGALSPEQVVVRSDPDMAAENDAVRVRRATASPLEPHEASRFRSRLLRAFTPNESANAPDDD